MSSQVIPVGLCCQRKWQVPVPGFVIFALNVAMPPEQIVVAPVIIIVGSLTTVISIAFEIEHSCPLSTVTEKAKKQKNISVAFLK